MWMMPLHVNQKSDYDDDDMFGAESFQIIWVIGVRPNLVTWVVGISLRGRGRKNIICPQKERSFIKSSQKKV